MWSTSPSGVPSASLWSCSILFFSLSISFSLIFSNYSMLSWMRILKFRTSIPMALPRLSLCLAMQWTWASAWCSSECSWIIWLCTSDSSTSSVGLARQLAVVSSRVLRRTTPAFSWCSRWQKADLLVLQQSSWRMNSLRECSTCMKRSTPSSSRCGLSLVRLFCMSKSSMSLLSDCSKCPFPLRFSSNNGMNSPRMPQTQWMVLQVGCPELSMQVSRQSSATSTEVRWGKLVAMKWWQFSQVMNCFFLRALKLVSKMRSLLAFSSPYTSSSIFSTKYLSMKDSPYFTFFLLFRMFFTRSMMQFSQGASFLTTTLRALLSLTQEMASAAPSEWLLGSPLLISLRQSRKKYTSSRQQFSKRKVLKIQHSQVLQSPLLKRFTRKVIFSQFSMAFFRNYSLPEAGLIWYFSRKPTTYYGKLGYSLQWEASWKVWKRVSKMVRILRKKLYSMGRMLMMFFSIRRVLSKAQKKMQKLGRSSFALTSPKASSFCWGASLPWPTLGTDITWSHSLNSLMTLSRSCLSSSWSGLARFDMLKQFSNCLFLSFSIFIFPCSLALSSRHSSNRTRHPKAYSVAIFHNPSNFRYSLNRAFSSVRTLYCFSSYWFLRVSSWTCLRLLVTSEVSASTCMVLTSESYLYLFLRIMVSISSLVLSFSPFISFSLSSNIIRQLSSSWIRLEYTPTCFSSTTFWWFRALNSATSTALLSLLSTILLLSWRVDLPPLLDRSDRLSPMTGSSSSMVLVYCSARDPPASYYLSPLRSEERLGRLKLNPWPEAEDCSFLDSLSTICTRNSSSSNISVLLRAVMSLLVMYSCHSSTSFASFHPSNTPNTRSCSTLRGLSLAGGVFMLSSFWWMVGISKQMPRSSISLSLFRLLLGEQFFEVYVGCWMPTLGRATFGSPFFFIQNSLNQFPQPITMSRPVLYCQIIKLLMSLEKLPQVAYKNGLQRQRIAQKMFNHRKRLLEMDLKKPQQRSEVNLENYRALHDQNPKKDYYLQTKYTQIERENRLLFEKISNIKRKKKSRESLPRMKSLNTTYRRRQVEEIEIENARMYSRLIKQKPFISFKATDRDFHENKRRVERLSKHEKYKMEDWY